MVFMLAGHKLKVQEKQGSISRIRGWSEGLERKRMDHLCYVDKKLFTRLELGDEICLRVRRNGRKGITWQVFERDFVYLASKQRPRRVEFKCMVYAVEEMETAKECSRIETVPVCNAYRKRWTDRESGFIRVILVDRMRFSLPLSRGALQACWEPIGNIKTIKQGGEKNANTKI